MRKLNYIPTVKKKIIHLQVCDWLLHENLQFLRFQNRRNLDCEHAQEHIFVTDATTWKLPSSPTESPRFYQLRYHMHAPKYLYILE